MRKETLFILACIGVISLITILYKFSTRPSMPPTPHQGSITGAIECLPHKNTSGPQTLECAFGLRGDDDQHYLLVYKPATQDHIPVGQRVKVFGDITAQTHPVYDIIAKISVSNIKSLGK